MDAVPSVYSVGLADGDVFVFSGFVTGLSSVVVFETGKVCIVVAALIRLSPHPISAFPVCVISSRIVARSLGYTLVMNNMKEFSRVRDLKTENWAV